MSVEGGSLAVSFSRPKRIGPVLLEAPMTIRFVFASALMAALTYWVLAAVVPA